MNFFDECYNNASPRTVAGVRHKIYESARADNYGDWSIKHALLANAAARVTALQVIMGQDSQGKMSLQNPPPRDRYKLKVLSRVACAMDKDRNKLTPYTVGLDELPKKGDIVRYKIGKRQRHDGKTTKASDIQAWEAMGEETMQWQEFEIDHQGCIDVPPYVAVALLQKHGQRIAMPKFKRNLDGVKNIKNWLFEEVTK
jgi:hypothetical protein